MKTKTMSSLELESFYLNIPGNFFLLIDFN